MADNRVVKTTIELAGEGSYRDKLKQIGSSLKTLASQQKVVDAQYDKGDKSLAALTARQGIYQDKLDLQKRKLEAVGAEYARVAEAEGEDSEATQKLLREMNYAEAQMIKTEKELNSLNEEINAATEAAEENSEAVADAGDAAENAAGDIKQLGSASSAAEKNMDKIKTAAVSQGDALRKLGEDAQATAGKLSNMMAGATAAAVTYGVKSFMDFENEAKKVETLADQNVYTLEELSAQALKASNDTHIAAKEIMGSAYGALSSGVDTQNLMTFMTAAGKATKAGFAEIDDVVNGSTSAMNAWKISYSDAATVFGKMLVAQDEGKTTLGEISKGIGQITGIAPQLNLSLDETLASVAALTKNGVATSAAFTGLRAVMSNVIKPSSEAAEMAKSLGLEFDAAAIQSKGFTGFLQDVLEKTGGDTEKLAKLFGSVEGLSQIMLLGGSAAGDYQHALESMAGSTGKLDKAFSTVTSSRAEKLSASLNGLKNNAIMLGQSLAPYIDIVTDALGKLSVKLSGMDEEQMRSALQMGLWITAGLKAISMISKLTSGVKLLGAAFSGPAGWITLAIGGVAALVAGLSALESKMPSFEKSLDKLFDNTDEDRVESFKLAFNAEVNVSAGDYQAKIDTEINNILTALKGIEGISETDEAAIISAIANGTGLDLLKQALIDSGVPEGEAEKIAATYTAAVNEITAALEGVTLSQTAKDNIIAIAATGGDVQGALLKYGVDETEAKTKAASITSAMSEITTALDGLNLTKDQKDKIVEIAKAGGDVKAALIGYGVDETEAGNAAAKVTSAVDKMNAAVEGLELSQEAKDKIVEIAAAGGDVRAALIEYGVDETEATEIAAKITDAVSKVGTAIEGVDVSPEVRAFLLSAFTDRLQLRAALALMGVPQGTIDSILASYDNLNNSLAAKIKGVYSSIASALTDGKADTPEVKKELEEQVRKLYADATSEIETWINDEIAKLNVNSETYDTEVANIKAKGEEMKTSLQEQQTATLAFISEMAGKSTEEVQARLGDLETIEKAVREVIAEIEYAKMVSGDAGARASRIVRSGAVTNEETAGRAFGYEKSKRDNNLTALKEQYDKDVMALEEQYDALGAEEYSRRARELEKEYETATQAELLAYQSAVSQLVQGLGLALKNTNTELGEDLDIISSLEGDIMRTLLGGEKLEAGDISDRVAQAAVEALGWDADTAKQNIVDKLNAYWIQGDTLSINTLLDAILNPIKEDAMRGMEGKDIGFVGNALQGAIESGVFEGIDGIDLSSSENKLNALFSGLFPIVQGGAEIAPMPNTIPISIMEGEGYFDGIRAKVEAAIDNYKKAIDEAKQAINRATAEDQINAFEQAMRDKLASGTKVEDADISDAIAQAAAKKWELDPNKARQLLVKGLNDRIEKGNLRGLNDVLAPIMDQLREDIANGEAGEGDILSDSLKAAIEGGASAGVESADLTQTGGLAQMLFGELGKNASDGFAQGVDEDAGYEAGAALAGKSVEGGMDGLDAHSPSRKFVTIGEYAGQGLVQGLRSKMDAVFQAARALALAAERGAKITLRINSPSKVFEEIGGFTAEGMIRGVRGKASSVENAMRQIMTPPSMQQGFDAQLVGGTAGAATIITNVNTHYSGAFTRNEARRFGNALNDNLAVNAATRGR